MSATRKKVIVAGALGNCVHVAGVVQFLRIAEELGYETHFLGAAVPVERWIDAVDRYKPTILGVSYRLTPTVAESLFQELERSLGNERLSKMRLVFGGTPPVCGVAQKYPMFEHCFDGFETMNETRHYLSGRPHAEQNEKFPNKLLPRIKDVAPIPILRHHFGLPDLEKTIEGVSEIAESGVVDVISLAPDQNAQQSFFRQEEMNRDLDGAGGVPVRSREDLLRIKNASHTGNFPLLRIYSGTRDLIPWAVLSATTIDNAWGAVPLCWYSALDGRSDRPLEEAIRENIQAMRWYGQRRDQDEAIPLEVNESHHWSLREAHDTVAVTMAFLAAYNAKVAGVESYIAQYMNNTPPTTSPAMDLAKMLAKIELIESLHDASFQSYRQVRAGLLHLSPNENIAKGQLATSTAFALQLRPNIIHVVGYCEGDHAAHPKDVIESCEIVHGVIRNSFYGQPAYLEDAAIQTRKEVLLKETKQLLEAIRGLGDGETDPFTDPVVLAKAIKIGLMDAPHLKGNVYAAGLLETREINGAIYAWNSERQQAMLEEERIKAVFDSQKGEIKWAG